MSHNEEYQKNFIPGVKSIIITPYLTLESPYGNTLDKDSYNNPRDAILKITNNNNEDVVFNGIVNVEKGVTEYGNITCRHIIFVHNTKCIISKIYADSVDAIQAKVKYSVNNYIMSFRCDKVKNINYYFPNLIIKSEFTNSNGSELMCIITDEEGLQALFNISHEYYSAVNNSGIYKKRHSNIGNTELCFLNIDDTRDEYIFGRFLLRIIDCVKENSAALIKNANK